MEPILIIASTIFMSAVVTFCTIQTIKEIKEVQFITNITQKTPEIVIDQELEIKKPKKSKKQKRQEKIMRMRSLNFGDLSKHAIANKFKVSYQTISKDFKELGIK